MKPVLFHLFGLPVPSWHVFFSAASLAAFFCFVFLSSRRGLKIPVWDVAYVFSGAYLGVITGSVLWASLVESHVPDWSHAAMSSSGGILGGVLGGVLVARSRGLPVTTMADLAAIPVLLGIGLGRIGCFLNGDDYGTPVDWTFSRLGVVVPALGDGIARHPVQIYESLACFAGAGIVLRMGWSQPGRSAGFAMVWYALFRFWIEGMRADWRGLLINLPGDIAGDILLSPPRFAVMVLIFSGALLLIRPWGIRE